MKIPVLKFLGIGSAFNPYFNNTSAYFEFDSELFLIDCGEGVFSNLYKLKLLERYKTINVLITHTHSDHVATLGHLLLYCFYELNKKVKVFFPEESLISSLLSSMGVEKDIYDLVKLNDIFIYKEKLTIISIEQAHVYEIPCFGYIIETGECRFFYSGDSKTINQLILDKFLKGEIDFLYQDTCSENFNGNHPHLSLAELSQLIPPEKRSYVFCIHLDIKFNFNLASSLGFRIPEQIQI
ncbi:MBL fold metallo-hydrolase [Caldicellulosiruptor acetigenus]|uniref:Beta-lactamase superfamily hydrolase n=1 Tax=Caldicellulosiruptor acetigenus 6A TaxID=632516 RepID=G2PZ64_9FIRM|nr:MBL fold metallo-hydrolase [Caldicellulosiruptor acetigenus]AEM74109.1 beta-lactamase superfamily hydrolase [Caldicellulosiruptor acetigenus 6A]